MSREIKFRAWVAYEWEDDGNTPKAFKMIDWFSEFFYDTSPVTGYGGDFPACEDKSVILMQYTGLKDKNDVEVYEGDVVKVDDDGDCYLSDVYFDGGALCISVEHCDFDYTAIGWAIGSQCGIESIEVIGNIHENPELLNE